MWLALQQLGAVPPDAPTPREIASSGEMLRDAEQAMLARGDFQIDAEGAQRLAGGVAAVIQPAVVPDAVCVVTITGVQQGEPTRTVCFSRAAQRFVINWVNGAEHHMLLYAPEDAAAAAWQHLASICDTNVDESKTSDNASTQTVEHAMKQARQTVLLMCIQDVQSAKQRSSALSWFVSEQTVWLIEQQEFDQLPQQISRNHLSDVVQTFIGQILK